MVHIPNVRVHGLLADHQAPADLVAGVASADELQDFTLAARQLVVRRGRAGGRAHRVVVASVQLLDQLSCQAGRDGGTAVDHLQDHLREVADPAVSKRPR